MTYLPLLNANQGLTSQTSSSTQQQSQQQNTNARQGAGRWYDATRSEEVIRVNGGYELVICPLYKRFLAEVLDVFLLFLIKIIVFVVLIDLFDVSIALDIDIADLKDMKFLEDDYTQLLNLSSEFVLLEILTKIISCLYEAVFNVKFGATIGKINNHAY